ncbi:hypothetical protein R1T43_03955 [Alteromonas sp. CI.11.F.A3]|uniref:hypothetical protein n=1 Tax=Alteromonas sp. CI.11.F.A3 TaxID=3079555 RepID=UPI002943F006|nr:hypothetical protein [Alteromonas sp. CI.11.F.A3]WOI38203.1 hypothetical protein R1T43_03955 [Alteromonas sp. CI.11.F.A3]
MSCDVTAIFVTYKMIDAALNNIDRFVSAIPSGRVVLVDNSPCAYRNTSFFAKHIARLTPRCHFIKSDINCRFHAYNLALSTLCEGKVLFRTDDDEFDEQATAQLLSQNWEGFAVTPHHFDRRLQTPDNYQRPLESCIFDLSFLEELLPFQHKKVPTGYFLRRHLNCAHLTEVNRSYFIKQVMAGT